MSLKNKDRINRILSALLLYALFFQEFVPFARAMETINNNASLKTSGILIDMEEESSAQPEDEIIVNALSSDLDEVNAKSISLAVSGGPGQSESSGFSLGSTDGLVDKFSGDFSYSIPLMDVEGYPIVLNYNSNIGMNADATWVGLGWDLNVGAVSREMRGLPDEFNGNQKITKTFNQKDNSTINGFKAGGYISWEKADGFDFFKTKAFPSVQLTALFGRYNNSYVGLGKTFDFGLQSSVSIGEKVQVGPSFGFGFSRDSKNGIGRNFNVGLKVGTTADASINIGGASVTYGKSFSSRSGLQSQSVGLGVNSPYMTNKTNIGSLGSSGSIMTYGSVTAVPSSSFSGTGFSTNTGLDLSHSFEAGKSKVTLGIKFSNYESENKLNYPNTAQVFSQPAFGYLHSGKRSSYLLKDHEYPIMDYNKTGNSGYSENMKNLPFSMQTYDVFRVNSLGISGTFRPGRNDIGTYYETPTENKSNGSIIDFQVNFSESGPSIGASGGTQKGEESTGSWVKGGNNVIEFGEQAQGDSFDESVYFKSLGEMTPTDQDLFDFFKGENRSRLNIEINSFDEAELTTNLESFSNNFTPLPNELINSNVLNSLNTRQIIATQFDPKVAGDPNILNTYTSREEGTFTTYPTYLFPRVNTITRATNHLSEIDVVSSGGMSYTYGIPAYNLTTNEVSFSVGEIVNDLGVIESGHPVDIASNLVRYEAGDNSISNDRGRMNFYDKTTVPAYAHSFLLTEMKSSDYVDLGTNGPSVEDIGSYYKINHSQIYGEATHAIKDSYKWRFPISDDDGVQAIHNESFQGTDLDDMANYTYGEKEIWYTHSIESKNFIAEFYLEDREDAYGVLNEDGKIDETAPLKLLKKIVLYNRSERLESQEEAIPLQTVEFFYDYSLCKNAPANKHTYNANLDYSNSGKLTLTEIRVFTGNSQESGLSKYTFDYSTENPDFSYANIDAWGNYKMNDLNRPNHYFPYVDQDETTANLNVNAWRLVAIDNPLGGRVEIDYEADRYAYVQDKRAMLHTDIHGMMNIFDFLKIKNEGTWNGTDAVGNQFSKDFVSKSDFANEIGGSGWSSTFNFTEFNLKVLSPSLPIPVSQYNKKFDVNAVPNNVLVFQLENPIDGTLDSDLVSNEVREKYFTNDESSVKKELTEVLFKVMVDLRDKTGNDIREYLPVIASISKDQVNPFNDLLPYEDNFSAIGVMPPTNGEYQYGYVILEPANSGDREMKNDSGTDIGGLLLHPIQRAALDFVRQNLPDKVYGSCDGCDVDLSIDTRAFFGGDIYKYMIKKGGYVQTLDLSISTMRMFAPENIKFGGGSRVSKITYKDNWNFISNEFDSEYSWSYDYSTRMQETGVATFEPRAALDECALYEWDTYVDSKKKFPDETRFTPTPIAQALFPIPSVGYSTVEVRFSGGLTQGYSKSEYYTAKDFPTIEKKLTLKKVSAEKVSALSGNSVNRYGMSQGFVIVTNDFHGKPKEFSVFNSLNQVQSRSTYVYNDLTEKLDMIDRQGVVSKESIAMEYDIHAHSSYLKDASRSFSIGLTLAFQGGFPIIFPSLSKQKRIRQFNSHSIVKHINRSAVLKRIETEYLGSINTARNLLYDKYTGNVLLSSLTDEYEDELYSMSFPSHWRHRELRDVYPAENRVFSNMNIAGSVLDLSTASEDVFSPGDMLLISPVGSASEEAWILTIDGTLANLIDVNGNIYNGNTGIVGVRIKKSGRNNRLQESMQSITTKKEILVPSTGGTFVFPEAEILSCSAISYRDKNNVRCKETSAGDLSNLEVVISQPFNPFLYGAKGDLVLDGQFAWKSERVNADNSTSADHGTRFDGAYASFIPFYKLENSIWHSIPELSHPNTTVAGNLQNWRKLGEVTRYDEYGKALESEDQINVSSSVLYGFNNELSLLPVAQAVNAKQQEIAFDGFEDYGYYQGSPLVNEETHFDFKSELSSGEVMLNETTRHSGLTSLELSPGANAQVDKNVAVTCNSGVNEYSTQFIADECLCVAPFEPTEGEYVIGVWVKVGNDPTITDYSNAGVEVIINGNVITPMFTSEGTILDGWQRLEGEFTIPPAASTISVRLVNNSVNQAYFDDLRIHPFLAGMTTVVYDPKTLLPMATHDGYNFTTYFNYDENLNQVRVRVETIEGIKTISETEFGGQKKFNSIIE